MVKAIWDEYRNILLGALGIIAAAIIINATIPLFSNVLTNAINRISTIENDKWTVSDAASDITYTSAEYVVLNNQLTQLSSKVSGMETNLGNMAGSIEQLHTGLSNANKTLSTKANASDLNFTPYTPQLSASVAMYYNNSGSYNVLGIKLLKGDFYLTQTVVTNGVYWLGATLPPAQTISVPVEYGYGDGTSLKYTGELRINTYGNIFFIPSTSLVYTAGATYSIGVYTNFVYK